MCIIKVFISSRNRGCSILKQKKTYTKYKDSCLSHLPAGFLGQKVISNSVTDLSNGFD